MMALIKGTYDITSNLWLSYYPHGHMIMIRALSNQLAIKIVLHDQVIIICNLSSQIFPQAKSVAKLAGSCKW